MSGIWRQLPAGQVCGAIKSMLTRQQRLVCAAYWFDGLRQKEIALKFGMTQQAVSRKIQRAVAKLESCGIEPPAGRAKPQRVVPVAQLSTCGDLAA